MKQYWIAIGIRENEVVRASFSTEKAAKEYAEYLAGDCKDSFYCLVREPKRISISKGRKITDTLASKIRQELPKAIESETVNSYYRVDKHTWLANIFGNGMFVKYYSSCIFIVDFDNYVEGKIQDVTCFLYSEYLTWSTMNRMQSACRLVPYAVGFGLIDGEPWLEGNGKQVRVPVDKPFSLMRYVKVLFNEF